MKPTRDTFHIPEAYHDRMWEARERANTLRYAGPSRGQARATFVIFGVFVGLVLALALTAIAEAPARAACTVLQAEEMGKW